jgi:RimJ/RimL family protein N-acetyltransferase
MDFSAFNAYHRPALERDEARHTLILALMERAAKGDLPGPTRSWSFAAPGSCAIQTPGRLIILGEPDKAACEQLAEEVAGTRFHGVTGNDDRAFWFADRAKALGAHFGEAEPQEILAITEAPAYPGAPGEAAPVRNEDADLFAEWFEAFRIEAVPNDLPAPRAQSDRMAGSGDYLFWVAGGRPVSLAGIVRRTRNAAAIAIVYTPPELRGRGYAGSATAAVVEKIYAEDRRTACLYVDLRNPASTRCYAKIGFKPVCKNWVIRQADE